MVNEINKPPTDITDNENVVLAERLLASNRNLQDMQAEHRQLMQEMESLRLRATELSQLTAQGREPQPQPQQEPQVEPEREPELNHNTSNINLDELNVVNTTTAEASPTAAANEESTDPEDDAASAEYIRAKFSEIAALKAQYARVQNMINTTNLIEQHIAEKEKAPKTSTHAPKADEFHSAGSVSTSTRPTAISPAPAEASLPVDDSNSSDGDGTGGSAANEELLSTMLNMFTDFTSELRSEADSLRAERDRLRALKEEIMRHRQRPS